MTSTRTTVGTTYTLIADWTGLRPKTATISRESEQEMQIVYGPPAPAETDAPEWIVTKSFVGIRTRHLPSGGQMYARMVDAAEDCVVNYD
jgi:hypothetical protein